MKKRLLSLILTMAMCMSLGISTYAQEPTTQNISESVITEVENLLCSIAFEKEFYGFEDVDMSSIWIGTPIACYEVVDTGIVPLTGIILYPIYSENGDLVSMVFATSGNNATITLSSNLVDLISGCSANMDNIAFVYDTDAVYCWDGDELVFLAENGVEGGVEGRLAISDIDETEFSKINTTELEKSISLEIASVPSAQGEGDSSAYVQAPVKRQPTGSNWCWAACMASIVQLEGKGNYTTRQMAAYFSITDENVGRNAVLIPNDFAMFSLSVTTLPVTTSRYLVDILNSISYGHAVYGMFTSDTKGHAMVIRGIDGDGKNFSVMDPEASGSSYQTGSIIGSSNSGTLSIISSTGGFYWTAEAVLLVE